MKLVFEGGLYAEHEHDDPEKQAANLAWFEQQWARLRLDGYLVTDAGGYIKTAHGFRRAGATHYSVHFRKGALQTFTEPAQTIEEARAIKARLDAAHGQHGRRAMIYAIVDGVSFCVS